MNSCVGSHSILQASLPAGTHQTENPRGFSEVGKNLQLLMAIVGIRYCIQN